jgi:septum formation protein
MRLVLASASPRRRELLAAAGLIVHVDPVDVDEQPRTGEPPEDYVARVAAAKAAAGRARHPDAVVIGADTTVVVDGDMLGKPEDDHDAARMLRQLSGRRHDVLTGITVMAGHRAATRVERTGVWFATLSADDVAWYVASGEPRDKAGAYAIQGLAARFIPRIEGSYSNVVGLPVAALWEMLRDVGLETRFPEEFGDSTGARP